MLKILNKFMFHRWHSSCWSRQQPVIYHTWWQVMIVVQQNWPAISTSITHQCSFATQTR